MKNITQSNSSLTLISEAEYLSLLEENRQLRTQNTVLQNATVIFEKKTIAAEAKIKALEEKLESQAYQIKLLKKYLYGSNL